jgi:glutathione synthase/RimK-type ligase-like ATP-grasp enzyme
MGHGLPARVRKRLTRSGAWRLHLAAWQRCMLIFMKVLFVVDRAWQWPFEIAGADVASARTYLTDPAYSSGIRPQVVNLCRADRYQGRGYYVSLLAEARGHRPLPDVKTIEDLQVGTQRKMLAEKLADLAGSSIRHDATDRFEIDAYFGRDPAEQHPEIAQQLFAAARAPLIRAHFKRENGAWRLDKVAAIGVSEIPPQHRAFLLTAATQFVAGDQAARTETDRSGTPKIAILCDPQEQDRPSNDEALRKFVAAAPKVGLTAEIIGPQDIERLPQFDGLFIRTTTNVGQYTYEFSRRAQSLGIVVIDDPDSILRCTNKVYLNELMQRHKIPTPKTMVVHRGNLGEVVPALKLPCILKQPDGGFGLGVVKIEHEEQLAGKANRLLESSELLVAQEWLPTEFDWRVCVFDRRPLFVCKYFMAPGHWQIVQHGEQTREGKTLALSVGEAPEIVVSTAMRAANLIGSGLYGVDLKQVGDKCLLIEINDNPNVDAGNEDQVLKGALYREVMGVFARRIAEQRGRRTSAVRG